MHDEEADEESPNPLTINTDQNITCDFGPQFTGIQPLGHGATGIVFSAHDEDRNRDVAIKTLALGRQTLREIKILSRLKHENVVEILDIIARKVEGGGDNGDNVPETNQVLVIQELLDTDLHSVIQSRQLQEDHIVFFTYQLLRGLKYIHSLSVIHRDLKPCNILVNCDTLELKIADFGISRIVDSSHRHKVRERNRLRQGQLSPYAGSCWYHAPELVLSPRTYGTGVDIWAVGCIIMEMLTATRLFSGATPLEQLRQIVDVVFLTEQDWSHVLRIMPNKMLKNHPFKPRWTVGAMLGDAARPAVIDLVECLLTFDCHHRPDASEALAHPYLRQYYLPADEPQALTPLQIEHEVDDELTPGTLCCMIVSECRLNPSASTCHVSHISPSSPARPSIPAPSASPPLSCTEEMHTLDEILSIHDTAEIEIDDDEISSSSSSHQSSSVEDLNLRNLRNSQENLMSSSSYNILQLGVEEVPEIEEEQSPSFKEEKYHDEKELDEKDVAELSAQKLEEDKELERIIQSYNNLTMQTESSTGSPTPPSPPPYKPPHSVSYSNNPSHPTLHSTPRSHPHSHKNPHSHLRPPSQPSHNSPAHSLHPSQPPSQKPTSQNLVHPPSHPNSQKTQDPSKLRVCIEHKHQETLLQTHTPPRARSPSCNHCIYISDDEEFKEKKLLEMDSASGGGTLSKVNADNMESEKNDHDLDEMYRLPTEHLRSEDNNRDYSNQRLKHKHLSKIHVRQLLRYRDEINELNERLREEGACGGYEEEEGEEVLGDGGIVLTSTNPTTIHTTPLYMTDRLTIQLNEQQLLTARTRATDGFSSPEEQPSSPRQQQQPQQANTGARPKKSPRKQKAL